MLGSFVSEKFIHEMQEGTIALLDGLLHNNPESRVSTLQRAREHFQSMEIEGGIELADDYIAALEDEDRLKRIAGLFPEQQTRLLDPFNEAVDLYNRVIREEVGIEERRTKILQAVERLRLSERALGGISQVDVAERLSERSRSVWDRLSSVVAVASFGFLLVQVVSKIGGPEVVIRWIVDVVRGVGN